MLELHNRYLFLVEYGNPNQGADSATMGYHAEMANTLHEALAYLFKIPADQMHPGTALLNNMDRFIKNATVMDLVDGLPVVSTIYHPNINNPEYDCINLVVEAGVPVSALKASLGDFSDRQSIEHPAMFDFLNWDKAGEHMEAARAYKQLFEAVVHQIIAGDAIFIPHSYTLSLAGFNSESHQLGGQPFLPSLTVQHHFMTLDHAAIKLLLTPSTNFDFDPANQQTNQPFFNYARINFINNDFEALAICRLQPPGIIPEVDHYPQAGRYLEFNPQFLDVLVKLGLPGPHFQTIAALNVIQLDNYPQSQPWRLSGVASLEGFLKNLQASYGENGPHLDYETKVVYKIAVPVQEEVIGFNPVIERVVHTHTNDLEVALFQLFSNPIKAFNELELDTASFYIDKASILDNHKKPLLSISDIAPDPDLFKAGIYMGIAPQMMIHPAFNALHPAQLTADDHPFIKHNGISYVQIGVMKESEIMATAGYQTFSINLLASYFTAQLQQRPEIRKYPSRTISADGEFMVTLNWAFRPDINADIQHITLLRGSSSAANGLFLIKALGADLFHGKELANQNLPLHLTSATLWQTEHGRQMALFKKMLDPQDETKFSYYLHSKGPTVADAFTKVIGQDHLEAALANASRLGHIERFLRNDDPHKKKGPQL